MTYATNNTQDPAEWEALLDQAGPMADLPSLRHLLAMAPDSVASELVELLRRQIKEREERESHHG